MVIVVRSKATWWDMPMQSFLNSLGMVYQGILVVDVDVGKCPMFFEGRQSVERFLPLSCNHGALPGDGLFLVNNHQR